ncbi:MAG: hypothetical protein H7Y30_00600 [Pyrinomonadaceae bacterium]|nr:hypothetical protein [Pyrinomonadaceae bacterium]
MKIYTHIYCGGTVENAESSSDDAVCSVCGASGPVSLEPHDAETFHVHFITESEIRAETQLEEIYEDEGEG